MYGMHVPHAEEGARFGGACSSAACAALLTASSLGAHAPLQVVVLSMPFAILWVSLVSRHRGSLGA